jgi:hypothetical protein
MSASSPRVSHRAQDVATAGAPPKEPSWPRVIAAADRPERAERRRQCRERLQHATEQMLTSIKSEVNAFDVEGL